jgi:hypothetical protein
MGGCVDRGVGAVQEMRVFVCVGMYVIPEANIGAASRLVAGGR